MSNLVGKLPRLAFLATGFTFVVGVFSLICTRKIAVAHGAFIFGSIAVMLALSCIYLPGAHGIDIQVPGKQRSLLFEPQRYNFSSPIVADFQDQKHAILCMVTQGDTSVFETKWCADGGANRHVHSVPTDFKNYRSMNIPVHVAK